MMILASLDKFTDLGRRTICPKMIAYQPIKTFEELQDEKFMNELSTIKASHKIKQPKLNEKLLREERAILRKKRKRVSWTSKWWVRSSFREFIIVN